MSNADAITPEQIAGILAFEDADPAGRTTPYNLHSDDAIAQRRKELAAERAANPVTNDSIQKLLNRFHATNF